MLVLLFYDDDNMFSLPNRATWSSGFSPQTSISFVSERFSNNR